MYLNRAFKYAEFLFSDTFRSARTPDSPLSLYEGWSGDTSRPHNPPQTPARDRLLPCRSFASRPGGLSFLRSLLLILLPILLAPKQSFRKGMILGQLCLPHTSWQYLRIHSTSFHQRLGLTCHKVNLAL